MVAARATPFLGSASNSKARSREIVKTSSLLSDRYSSPSQTIRAKPPQPCLYFPAGVWMDAQVTGRDKANSHVQRDTLFYTLRGSPLGFGPRQSLPQLDIRAVGANLNINEFAGFGMATQLVRAFSFLPQQHFYLLWV